MNQSYKNPLTYLVPKVSAERLTASVECNTQKLHSEDKRNKNATGRFSAFTEKQIEENS